MSSTERFRLKLFQQEKTQSQSDPHDLLDMIMIVDACSPSVCGAGERSRWSCASDKLPLARFHRALCLDLSFFFLSPGLCQGVGPPGPRARRRPRPSLFSLYLALSLSLGSSSSWRPHCISPGIQTQILAQSRCRDAPLPWAHGVGSTLPTQRDSWSNPTWVVV